MQGKSGMDMYKEFEMDRDQGNFDKLPELHAVLSGMKVSQLSRPAFVLTSHLKTEGRLTCVLPRAREVTVPTRDSSTFRAWLSFPFLQSS